MLQTSWWPLSTDIAFFVIFVQLAYVSYLVMSRKLWRLQFRETFRPLVLNIKTRCIRIANIAILIGWLLDILLIAFLLAYIWPVSLPLLAFGIYRFGRQEKASD